MWIFAYYKNDYGGTQIKTENDFKRAESISEAFVNQVTFWPDCKTEFGYRLNQGCNLPCS